MKILKAWIEDPTRRGVLEPPMLYVETDTLPDVTIPPEEFAGGWRVGKYGPFVNYWHEDRASASDFNIRFRNRFPVVVDIVLVTPNHETLGYSLPLTRARQLVRKHDPSWRLHVNERAAEAGRIEWQPIEIDPACRQWSTHLHRSGGSICGNKPARIIRVGNVDLPMCDTHVQFHNQKYAERRAAQTS